jgi:hypothetical protein
MRIKMPKDYEVTLYYAGSTTITVSAPNEDEAIELAHDELANLIDMNLIDVTDIESCQVDGSYDD